MFLSNKWAAALVLMGLAGNALATPLCGVYPNNFVCPTTPTTPESNSAVTGSAVGTTSFQQMLSISQAVTQSISFSQSGFGLPPAQLSSSGTGLSAGTGMPLWNVWGNVNQNENKLTDSTYGFQGDTRNITLGGDLRLSPVLTGGVSAAFDEGSVDTVGAAAHLATRGFALAPYLSYQISKTLSVDGVVGLGQGSVNRRNSGSSVSQGTDRLFFGANLNSTHWYGNIQVAGKVSILSAEEKSRNATDSAGVAVLGATTRLTQARLGAQVGYWTQGVMPYASLTYVNDLNRSTPTGLNLDKDGFVFAIGANLFSKNGLNGGVAITSETGRSSVKNDVFMANLNYRF